MGTSTLATSWLGLMPTCPWWVLSFVGWSSENGAWDQKHISLHEILFAILWQQNRAPGAVWWPNLCCCGLIELYGIWSRRQGRLMGSTTFRPLDRRHFKLFLSFLPTSPSWVYLGHFWAIFELGDIAIEEWTSRADEQTWDGKELICLFFFFFYQGAAALFHRTIECFELEVTFKAMWSNSPAVNGDIYSSIWFPSFFSIFPQRIPVVHKVGRNY